MTDSSEPRLVGLPTPPQDALSSGAIWRMDRETFLKKGAAGVVTLSGLGALLSACGSGAGTQAAAGGGKRPATPTGKLTVEISNAINFLDPARKLSSGEYALLGSMLEGLVRFNADFTAIEPALATRWERLRNDSEWVFHLRPNVKFHDGNVLDAKAVASSLEHYQKQAGSVFAYLFTGLKSIDSSDPSTVVVKFSAPQPDFLRLLPTLQIISPAMLHGSAADVTRRTNQHPVGTGPFRYLSQQPGANLIVQAFPDYWGDGPWFEQVVFRVVGQESAHVTALEAGDVDLISDVPPVLLTSLRANPSFAVSTVQHSWVVGTMAFACDEPPFDDVRARQAVAHALDKQQLVEKVLRGQAAVLDSPVPPGIYGSTPPSVAYDYDPAKAKQLLQAAGHTAPVQVKVTSYTTVPLAGQLGPAIVAQLNDAGFDASFTLLEQGVGVKDLISPKRKYHIHFGNLGWFGGSLAQFQGMPFITHYAGKEILAALQRVGAVQEGPERLAAIAHAQDLVLHELPSLSLWTIKSSDVFERSIKDYEAPRDGFSSDYHLAYRSVAA